jgi:hypothetical protein
LLAAQFRHLSWFSQRNAFVSMIAPEAIESMLTNATANAETLTISKARPDTLAPALPALYFLVLATNDNAVLQDLTPRLSVFTDSEEWAYADYQKIYRDTQTYARREAALEARCAELQRQLAAMQNASAMPPVAHQSWLGRLLKRLSS